MSGPETLKSEETVEEEVERKPLENVASPERVAEERVAVPVAVIFPNKAL